MSTANNYLFSPATNLVNDVFLRYIKPDAKNWVVLLVSRGTVVGLGAWALYQSLGTTSVLKKSLYAYTIYSAALTPVILAAFFWRRATAKGSGGEYRRGDGDYCRVGLADTAPACRAGEPGCDPSGAGWIPAVPVDCEFGYRAA